jgi:[ribosomal protein S18]-alanine N-acetyltransferase
VSGVFVARATAGHVDDLARLHVACHTHPWTREQIATEVAQAPPAAVLVARAGRRDGVRAACAYRVAADEMEILDVSVDPDWRRQGLARFLVRLAITRAARAGARRALLEVRTGNAPARALYASLGFVVRGVRRGYYSAPVEDALVLERAIPDC